jgi:hypothetical protein
MQTPARRFVSMSIGTFGKGHHTPEKVLTAEDPFTQVLLERIFRRGEALQGTGSVAKA